RSGRRAAGRPNGASGSLCRRPRRQVAHRRHRHRCRRAVCRRAARCARETPRRYRQATDAALRSRRRAGEPADRSDRCWKSASGSLRKKAAINAGRADIMPHKSADTVAPGIAVARLIPFRSFRDAGMLEFVKRQIFRLTVDRHIATRSETTRAFEVGRDIRGVVPVVELLLGHRRDVDAPHLQKRRGLARLLDRAGLEGKDLAVTVKEIIAPDRPAGRGDAPRRGLEADALKQGGAAQYIRVLQNAWYFGLPFS